MNKVVRWINASAGSGKTYTIKSMIDSLVESGENPESILCLTFTNAGAMEMKHRYLLTNGGAKSPSFETIHSFAKNILPQELEVISESTAHSMIEEAIELVLSEPKWEKFFELIHDEWLTIISDIKQVIMSGMPLRDSFLKNHIAKQKAKGQVTLSRECIKALQDHGLNVLAMKIMSNDVDVYESNFITKDLKLSRRIMPRSFISNPEYHALNEELNNAFKKILEYVHEVKNHESLHKSIICNSMIREVNLRYKKLKDIYNIMDFNDIIQNGLKHLKTCSEPIMRFRHLFLDEAQDTSEVQWNMIYTIALEILQIDSSSITVVGDEKQIIYQFNGASHTLYNRMKNKMKNAAGELNAAWETTSLTKSYRSSQVILDLVDLVMKSTPHKCKHTAAKDMRGFVKTWLPVVNSKEHINISNGWTMPDKQVIPAWIDLCVNEIKSLVGKKRLLNEDRLVEPSDIVILVPRRYVYNFILAEQLKQSQIPIRNSLFGMANDETVQDLLSIGSFAIDPKNDIVIVNLLKSLYFGWSNEEVEDFIINRSDTVWSILLASSNPKVKHVAQVLNTFLTYPCDLVHFYSRVIFHSEFGQCLLQNFRSETLLFWEKVVSMSHLSLSEFIFHIQHSYEPFTLNKNGLSLLTAHASKGKEFKIVFLCNSHLSLHKGSFNQVVHDNIFLVRGNYELYKRIKNKMTEDQEGESDQLMYVALTRCVEQLYVLPPLATDNINPKSWYSKIIKHLPLFEKNDDAYELKYSGGGSGSFSVNKI